MICRCEKLSHLFNFTRSSLLDLPPAVALILCELLYSQTTKTLHFLTPTTPTKDHRFLTKHFLLLPWFNLFLNCELRPLPVREAEVAACGPNNVACFTHRYFSNLSYLRSLPCEEEVNEVIRSRWKEDLRCNNVLQMLDSQRPIFLPTAAEVGFLICFFVVSRYICVCLILGHDLFFSSFIPLVCRLRLCMAQTWIGKLKWNPSRSWATVRLSRYDVRLLQPVKSVQ